MIDHEIRGVRGSPVAQIRRKRLDKGLLQPRAESREREFCIFTKDKKIQSRALEIVEYYKQHTPYTFGQALCRCMEQTRVTIAALSERTGISERQIIRFRCDQAKDIAFRTIIALCVALKLAQETAERLLNLRRYTLNCNDVYTQICRMFLEVNMSVEECNNMLKSFGLEPLTDGEIWAV